MMEGELPVDRERLWRTLMDMAQIGALPNGGCCRTALSADDKKGRDLFVSWCRDAGCEVSVDQVGNIYARRAGQDSSRPAVATGSHLDTQPHGGNFDGIYGVLAGLEVVRTLNDAGLETESPIDVIVWTNEEGVRFSPPLAGSSAFAGRFDVQSIHNSRTLDGTTVLEDLKAAGYLGDERPGQRKLNCFIEAHIEQGPILEAGGKTIGVVTDIQGIRWLRVTLTGKDGHAGTTPMGRRRDALLGAARIIPQLNELVVNQDEHGRLTVGRLDVEPNSGATIPGQVVFYCDLRHPEIAILDRLDECMKEIIHSVATASKLDVMIDRPIDIPPVHFPGELVDAVRDAANKLGYSNIDMVSGAGHDAMNIAEVAPAAMIFIPCKDGISHNEAESAAPEDLAAGAQVLLHVMLARAGRV
jgi:beta-ureidopropionase / N-carbamoyl-L-amino-acid hydrolase